MADPESEKRGAPGVLGACPQDFLVNIILANLGDFLKYLPKIGGGAPPGSATGRLRR